MKNLIIALVMFFFVCTVFPQTQTTIQDFGRLADHTGSTPLEYHGSAVNGQYMYNAGDNKIYIYKMTDPKNPTFIKTIPSLTGAQRVWTGENYIFVYTGNAIKIYDITDHENPLFKADYAAGSDLHKVSAKGNYMFVLYMMEMNVPKSGSFEIVDISNPASPQLKGTYKPNAYEGRAFCFSETANRVYVAHYNNAAAQGYIRELDYTTPTNPTQIRELVIPGGLIEMSTKGTTLFILKDGGWQGPSKLEAYDLSVSPIAQLASLQVSTGRAWDMHVYETSITVTLLETNGFKNYTWNAATKTFDIPLSLNIPNASQMSWYMVPPQGSGSLNTLRKTSPGYWLYFYYFVLEKYAQSMESETYGYYVRLVEVKIWIEVIDTKVTLITSVYPSEAAADGCTVTPAGTNQYSKNSTVSLNATAGTGWVFNKWTGSLTGSQNPQDLKMDNDKNVVGNFQPVLVLSLSSPPDNYLCPPDQNGEITITTANIFVDGVDWHLSRIQFDIIEQFTVDNYIEPWIEYAGKTTKGTFQVSGTDTSGIGGLAQSVSFNIDQQINEGNTLAVKLFFRFKYPSKSQDRYIPEALAEVIKFKVSINETRVECLPIPTSAQPGVKTPPYPPNILYSNTQTVASVWNVSKTPNIPFSTIQGAVASPQTSDNDLIRVCTGWYTETVVIDKPLTIFSTSGTQSTVLEAVDMHHAYDRNNIFTVKKSNTKISGFKFIKAASGISISNGTTKVNNCEIKDNVFTGNYSSIKINNGDYNNLHNNTCENVMRIIDGNNNTIENNVIGIVTGGYQVGLEITESSRKNIIKNNVVIGNNDSGIHLDGNGVQENEIRSNMIGTNADGTTALPNRDGILLDGSDRNIIESNLISGNTGSGILLSAASSSNSIRNNVIGTNALKTDKLPNNNGITMDQNNEGNLIENNLISSNAVGIILKWKCSNNEIRNNIIGSNESGTDKLPNAMGVMLSTECTNNTLDGNTIASNAASLAIIGYGTSGNQITNNKFGTNKDGTKSIPTVVGIGISGDATNNRVANNLISGHAVAITIDGEKTTNNIIENNKIGLDISGTNSLPNTVAIILLKGAKNNIVQNNLISGNSTLSINNKNAGFGVMISGNTTSQNIVQDNIFGLDATGSNNVANDFAVALYGGAYDNVIRRNTICNSKNVGISVFAYSHRNQLINNSIGTNNAGTLKCPNTIGVQINSSNENTITQNKIWYNSTGILEEESENFITQNDIKENTGNTGIHLKKSKSEISGNTIYNDKTDGIKCENASNPLIKLNNVFGNTGYGLINTDPNVKIAATNNWWGTSAGPGNSLSGNINGTNWLTSVNKLNVNAETDTLYLPENGIDSVSVFHWNSFNTSDKLLVAVSSDKNWVSSEKTFTVDLTQPNSGESRIKFAIPSSAVENETAKVIINVSSQAEPSLTANDTLHAAIYKSTLKFITTSPDTIACTPGDSVTFTARGYDQHKNLFPITLNWSADGGNIKQNGKFIAGNTEGLFKVTATETTKNLKSYSYVKISSVITSVEEDKKNVELPTEYSLSQNYPNPFNPSTKINYSLPYSSRVKITVYNILGQLITELIDEEKLAGSYTITWDAKNVASGIYFCRIEAISTTTNFIKTMKMILLK